MVFIENPAGLSLAKAAYRLHGKTWEWEERRGYILNSGGASSDFEALEAIENDTLARMKKALKVPEKAISDPQIKTIAINLGRKVA